MAILNSEYFSSLKIRNRSGVYSVYTDISFLINVSTLANGTNTITLTSTILDGTQIIFSNNLGITEGLIVLGAGLSTNHVIADISVFYHNGVIDQFVCSGFQTGSAQFRLSTTNVGTQTTFLVTLTRL